jgi:hypothetical protein
MNDEQLLNEEQLRLATSRTLPADVLLTEETAALREGFVALGKSLEVASGPIDEAGLVERLCKLATEEFSRGGAEARRVRTRVAESAQSDWSLLVGTALALATLIAIVRISTEWQRADIGAVAVAKAPPDAAVATSDVPEPAPLEISWNDPLDAEIAQAEATMGRFSAGSRGVDESLFDMNQELFLLGQELLGESL